MCTGNIHTHAYVSWLVDIMTPEFTLVHIFREIFITFSGGRFVRRSISCCTDANMISELNETQTHHSQEETKRFWVAPDGFLSELSSKNEGTGRRRSCASLVELNHRLQRENVFLGFMFLTRDDAIWTKYIFTSETCFLSVASPPRLKSGPTVEFLLQRGCSPNSSSGVEMTNYSVHGLS